MIHPMNDPARQRLKFERWPIGDQRAWQAALAPGDLLEGTVGTAHHWSPETQDMRRKAYGRWLTSQILAGQFDTAASPVSRITPEAVSIYVAASESQVTPYTTWGYLAGLHAVAVAFDPDEDWRWLRRLVRKLEARLRNSKDKHSRLRPAPEIFAWAIGRMQEITFHPHARFAATHYRDALMIALLISCPTMRLRNLTVIEIDRHLMRRSDGWELRFSGAEMKARKPIELTLPGELASFLEDYLAVYRPQLLGHDAFQRLWITQYGTPMTKKMVYGRICTATERAFGVSINPHLLRDCAATFVALNDPKHIGIAAPILGHSDPRTTERHYIQAQQVTAGRNLQASLRTLRKEFAPLQMRKLNDGV